MFRPLSQNDVREIVKLQLHLLLNKLEEKDIHLIPSEELIAHYPSRLSGISSTGFDPQILSRRSGIGARPIKRMIQKELLNELSSADHRRHIGDRQTAGDRSR